METLYRKVFIKDSKDLPKKAGYFDVVDKTKKFGNIKYNHSHADDRYWLSDIDWYLQPIEPQEEHIPDVGKTIEAKTAEIRQKISNAFTENSSDANNGQMLVITEDSYSDLIDEIIEIFQNQQPEISVTDEEIEKAYLKGYRKGLKTGYKEGLSVDKSGL